MRWVNNIYLPGAIIMRTIVLVNEYGVPNISHNKVSEHEISSIATTWSCPWLYSNAILRLCENRICYCYVRNSCFIVTTSQTSYAARVKQTIKMIYLEITNFRIGLSQTHHIYTAIVTVGLLINCSIEIVIISILIDKFISSRYLPL